MHGHGTMKSPRNAAGAAPSGLDPIICNLIMTPTPLLKFGSSGKPGFRMFQLSPDLLSLTWTSKNKAAAKTKVDIKDIKEIRYGQRTDKFKRNNRPDLENLSFSAIYVDANGDLETLDLVTKDEAEFQNWTRTLQALHENKIDIRPYQVLVPNSPTIGTLKKKNQTMKALKDSKNAFKEANDVYAFGWGEWGQNGFGSSDYENATQPKLLEPLLGKHVVQVASGWSHTVVLLESGQPLCYGNRVGTGLNDDFFLPNPITVPEKHTIISISCGHFHSAALTDGGRVLTWGCNVYGQLGHGDRKDVKDPRPVSAVGEVRSIACGGNFMASLADDGRVFTWGSGDHGALGHNDMEDALSPKPVQDLVGTDIKRIACGDSHMFACTTRETYAWGWNGSGQLGLGHEEDQHRPHVVEILRGSEVKDIAAGAAHSVAIVFVQKINVEIFYSWGLNSSGQCGQGKRAKIAKPSPLPDFKANELAEVQCGSFHTVLRCRNGEIYSCGSNKYGQLGLGTTQDVDELKCVDFLKDKSTRSITCGGENTAVLTARAWVEDSEAKECMACKAVFTFVNRKHHCRNCGGIFCGNCSNKKIAILKIQVTEPVRVCTNCYTMLGGR